MLKGGGALNPDGLSLDLAFALDKTLTARKGPTPAFTRSSTATFVGSNGLIQSAIIDAPRFDHDPATGASKGLLIEESRENFALHSQSFANIYWNAFSTASATDNTTTSPSGVASSASRITANSGTDPSRYRLGLFSITAGSSPRTASVFLKAGTHGFGVLILAFNKVGVGAVRSSEVRVNLATGSAVQTGTLTGFLFSVTEHLDGWWRIAISATSNASTAVEDQAVMAFGLSFNASGTSGAFAGTETVFGWGAQLEAGAFPLSYIPTTSGTAIRSADVCSIIGTDFSSFYNQPEGSVIINGDSWNGTAPAWCGFNSGSVNRVFEFVKSGSDLTYSDSNAGSTIIKNNPTYPNKFGYARGKASGYGSFGGVIMGTSGIIPLLADPNQLQIGLAGSVGTGYLNGCIKSLTYYRKQLSTLKLNTLTAP